MYQTISFGYCNQLGALSVQGFSTGRIIPPEHSHYPRRRSNDQRWSKFQIYLAI